MSTTNGKHTIYIDIDDEITSIIDKVKTSPGKIVALVLPKRATVLQSIINMKLLKKSAANAKKSIVLITSEAGLLPLAGAVGLHVAKTLQSKPIIPLAPDHGDSDDAEISEESDEPAIDKTKSIGALAAGAAIKEDETETIALDDIGVDDPGEATAKKSKGKLKKVFKIPNFDRFRLSLFLGILAVIILIVGWILAAVILPKADVVITTDTSTTVSNISFTASTAFKDLKLDKAEVPAVLKEVKKTDTEKATASGKKDNGAKASGTVVFYNCSTADKLSDTNRTIAAGTTITNGSLSFTTASDVTVQPSSFIGTTCQSNKPSPGVGITATKPGTEYNLASGSSFSVPSPNTINGSNAVALSGGTASVIVSIVSQDDVDAALAKMKGRLDTDAKKELLAQLQGENLKQLDETLVISAPVITAVPAVGSPASGDVSVTAQTTYSIMGIKLDYLSQLIKKDVAAKIDTTKQTILDNGLSTATIRLDNRKSGTEVQMSTQTLVVAGPKLDAEAIKAEIKGKKRGDAQGIISSKTGVKDVTITYHPFWVLSTPRSSKKITVTIEKPVVTKPATDTSVKP